MNLKLCMTEISEQKLTCLFCLLLLSSMLVFCPRIQLFILMITIMYQYNMHRWVSKKTNSWMIELFYTMTIWMLMLTYTSKINIPQIWKPFWCLIEGLFQKKKVPWNEALPSFQPTVSASNASNALIWSFLVTIMHLDHSEH